MDISTGAPYYRSHEVHQERWTNVQTFSNLLLAHLRDTDEVVLWVECDLVWEPSTLLSIAEEAITLGVVAAPVWRNGVFYDTHTTRRDGLPFEPPRNGGLVHVDSAAGCLAVRADIAQAHPFPDRACLGWTENMGGVWYDTNVSVEHP